MSGAADHAPEAEAARGHRVLPRRRALMLAPLAVAVAGGAGFLAMLRGLGDGSYDPHGIPSQLIGKPVPEFSLPPLEGSALPGLAASELRNLPQPVLVNFWASWCVPCAIEHPQLMRLHEMGVPVYGISYKDKPADAARFLAQRGQPFAKLGVDRPGRVAIDFGVYGVPESYFVDRTGIVRWRWPGPITPDVLEGDVAALLRRYK